MRRLVVLVCSLALVSVAYGAQKEEKKPQQKKQAQTAQRVAQPTRHPTGAGAAGKKASTAMSERQKAKTGQTSTTAYQGQKGKKSQTSTPAYDRQKVKKGQTSAAANQGQKAKKNQTTNQAQTGQKAKKDQTANQAQTGKAAARGGEVTRQGKPTDATTATAGRQTVAKGKKAQGKPLKPRHFNLPKQPNTAKAPPVKFQQGRRVEGSQNWHGQQYNVFRNYKAEWHDQNWWHSHYRNNIVFVFGAPYYWNAGYWFPAWGYYPNAYYAWDGPIYAHNRLPPDQVIANVQEALQQQGYYRGEVDGLIGPLTRGAIADYQRDHGLYMTSTIDQPTLQSLGMA
jgi:Putative peptidoglycan binding domain